MMMDPTIIFRCQSCNAQLQFSELEALLEASQQQTEGGHEKTKKLPEDYRIEESFVLLESKVDPENKGTSTSQGVVGTEDSYREIGPLCGLPEYEEECPGVEKQGEAHNELQFDDKVKALVELFEIASEETGHDHPLCVDCSSHIKAEMETIKKELHLEIAEYSDALKRLTKEKEEGNSEMEALNKTEEELEEELIKVKEECEREARRAALTESRLQAADKEYKDLLDVSKSLDELEEAYWHNFNDYQHKLRMHVDEKAALINKVNIAQEKLDTLRSTNVLKDLFYISHDGPFGTISGHRLGRTNEIHVEWDEINCAWGQAVFLLFTLARFEKLEFACCQLVPLGSRSKIIEKRNGEGKIHELYGPVNQMWGFSYDKAMTLFLTSLKEFADHANYYDKSHGKEDGFTLPFIIDGDKVDGKTVKLTLNKYAKWTKALKFMLADLQKCLYWMIEKQARQ